MTHYKKVESFMRKLVMLLPLIGVMSGVSFLITGAERPPGDSSTSEQKAASAKSAGAEQTSPPSASETEETPAKVLLSGKVVLLTEALKKRKIVSYADEIKGQVVLVTRAGELVPIVPDWRGRAFYQDERLRNRPVDLVVNRRPGVPWVQVLSIYTFDDAGTRNMTDYWCDICSIPMYEIKDCECCQAPIRLRFRPQELPAEFQ
jgi:hypothetical protein